MSAPSEQAEQTTDYACQLTLHVVVVNPAPGVGETVRRAAAGAAQVLDGHVTAVEVEAAPGGVSSATVAITIGYTAHALSPQEATAAGYGALFRFEPAARQVAEAAGGRLKTVKIIAVEARPELSR